MTCMLARRHRQYQIRMRRDEVRRLGYQRFGVDTDYALAAALRIAPGNFSELLRGLRQPYTGQIATMLHVLGEPFEALFEVDASPAP